MSTPGQAFYLLQSGSDWKITMSANQAKCLGPTNNGTANMTAIVIQDCNGSSAQNYTAMPMSTSGVYAFKNVASGRCLNIRGASTANSCDSATVRLRHYPGHQRPVQRPVTADLGGAPAPAPPNNGRSAPADRPFPFGAAPAGTRLSLWALRSRRRAAWLFG